MSTTKKSEKELRLSGYFDPERHSHLTYRFKGNTITSVEPIPEWSDSTQHSFKTIIESLVANEFLLRQDAPSLYMLGEYLEQIYYVNSEIKKIKDSEDCEDENSVDRIIKLQKQYINLERAFHNLGKRFWLTPDSRFSILKSLTEQREEQAAGKALGYIADGRL